MIPASGGSALVDGRSIADDMGHIRESLGVCPQFDILWPNISVREHLEIFAAIKGYASADRRGAAEAAANEVGERAHLPALCAAPAWQSMARMPPTGACSDQL